MKKHGSGFTLIELMIVVAIVGILSAVAIPSFIKYIRKSKTVEAHEALDKIKVGARSYWITEQWSSGGTILPKQFPNGVTAVPNGGPCCKRCVNASTQWDDNGWDTLNFAMTDPHYFQYTFSSGGATISARYTARAIGDLDCDTSYSTFEIRGVPDSEGAIVVIGPIITQEEE